MTVLRTLEKSPLVTSSTAERVQKYINHLGYQRDPVLSALSAYRHKRRDHPSGNVLAFIDCDRTDHSQKILHGLRAEAEFFGYSVEVFPLPPTAREQARLSHTLFHRGVRGLLFGPSHTPVKLAGWEWDHFAAISLGALAHQPPMHAVSMDYFHGASIAVLHLHQTGARHLGLVIEKDLHVRTDHRWLGGCLSTGHSVKVFTGNIQSPISVKQWLSKWHIDGVLTIHRDVHAMAMQRNIPTAFLNNFDCPPGVPRIRLDAGQIGVEGVRMLHHALLRGEMGLPQEPKTISLRGSWAVD